MDGFEQYENNDDFIGSRRFYVDDDDDDFLGAGSLKDGFEQAGEGSGEESRDSF